MARKKRRTTVTKKSKKSLPPELQRRVPQSDELSLTETIVTSPPLLPGIEATHHSDLHATWAARQRG